MTSVTEETLQAVRAHMRELRVAGPYDSVFKDQCMFSFDTPFSPDGLYVNLKTYEAFGKDYLPLDHQRSGSASNLYLHLQYTKKPVPKEEAKEGAEGVTKLAIGVEGGFQPEDRYTVEKAHELVVYPAMIRVPYPCPELPELVIQATDALIKHEGKLHQDDVAAWEEGPLQVSKYAKDLVQLPSAGKQVSPDPKDWKCEEGGDTENLWLNLSTGSIGSGRKNWDGSGGTGAALRHFEATGSQYPLVVKLGTITPQGADVFSYAPDENDLVEDPWLAEHLSHWGIDVMKVEKTEKTMAELNIALNKSFEFDKITEAGADLVPLSGPGYIGLKNMGNTCYMNSVLQVLFTLPEVQARYLAPAEAIFHSAPRDLANDLPTQLAKVAVGLETSRYASPGNSSGSGTAMDTDAPAVDPPEPRLFKTLIGKGHPEFSTQRQQDAGEFMQHLLEVMNRSEHAVASGQDRTELLAQWLEQPSTAQLFKFEFEDRIQCTESGQVTYKTRSDNILGLEIPMEAVTNKAEVEQFQEREQKRQKLKEESAQAYIGGSTVASDAPEDPKVVPVVPFDACIQKLSAEELVEDFYSSALGRKGVASKTVRFKTFPPYLIVQMRRYYVAPDWTVKKLDVLVEAPEELVLEKLRGAGMQPGEVPLPEEDPTPPAEGAGSGGAGGLEPDAGVVAQVVAMGFSENGAKRAAVATSNSGAEAAMEWVLSHMEDPDFNDPLPAPAPASGGGGPGTVAVDAEAVVMLTSMGFSTEHATGALQATDGNLERAADWLFSHADDLDGAIAAALGGSTGGGNSGAAGGEGASTTADALIDGEGRYSLVGFVSHMGANTACGHYVAHIKKEGSWAIYNDEKVAQSEKPPKDLGYLYVYKRV